MCTSVLAHRKLRKYGPDGHEVRQNSNRPLGVRPALWQPLSKKQREDFLTSWADKELTAEEKNMELDNFYLFRKTRKSRSSTAVSCAPLGVDGLAKMAKSDLPIPSVAA